MSLKPLLAVLLTCGAAAAQETGTLNGHALDLVNQARQRSPAGKRGLRPGAQRIVVTADRPVLVVGDLPENENARS